MLIHVREGGGGGGGVLEMGLVIARHMSVRVLWKILIE